MLCSILRCSNRSDSWRVLSSSAFLLSSSAFAINQLRIPSSAPCHCDGGAGSGICDIEDGIGGGPLGGSGNDMAEVIAAGGGKPR